MPDLVTATEDTNEAATKAAVFATAERLFALHGFQSVSVRDITSEAGVNLAGARSSEQLADEQDLWFRILEQLQTEAMPPARCSITSRRSRRA